MTGVQTCALPISIENLSKMIYWVTGEVPNKTNLYSFISHSKKIGQYCIERDTKKCQANNRDFPDLFLVHKKVEWQNWCYIVLSNFDYPLTHLEPQNLSYMWNYLFFTKIYANPLNCASIYVHISQQQSSVIPRITIN